MNVPLTVQVGCLHIFFRYSIGEYSAFPVHPSLWRNYSNSFLPSLCYQVAGGDIFHTNFPLGRKKLDHQAV